MVMNLINWVSGRNGQKKAIATRDRADPQDPTWNKTEERGRRKGETQVKAVVSA